MGALYVRRRPRVRVEPIQNGGGQERGLRSGTVGHHGHHGPLTPQVPTPLVVGLGEACALAGREMDYDHHYISRLSELLIQVRPHSATCSPSSRASPHLTSIHLLTLHQGITSQLPNVVRNGGDNVYPGCVNLSFHCVEVSCVIVF